MKKILLLSFLTITVFSMTSCSTKEITGNYSVIPLPRSVNLTGKDAFSLSSNSTIVYTEDNQDLQFLAKLLASYIKESSGLDIKTSFAGTKTTQNSIILSIANIENSNPESYKIVVSSSNISLTGASYGGLFYALQTLRKSIPVESNVSKIILPTAEILDEPLYQYRGMHLDVSRHFFGVKDIKTFIDMLALHNLNSFQWHLTEDQGWRIEIKSHPKLTQISSKRKNSVIGRNELNPDNTPKVDNTPVEGFYSQEEVKEILAYAKERNITVIPEIEMPGHAQAVLAAYPHLGCTGGPYEVWNMWGVSDDVFCAGNDSVFTLLEDVLTEVIDLFPSKYIHIGGDECPKTRWEKCPKCQARIKSLGITSDAKHPKEFKLQSYFISRIEQFVNSKDRSIIGWDEILEGGIAPNATLMAWRGINFAVEAAREKHDVIMTPTQFLYFDYYQSTSPSEPLAIGGYVPLEKVYSYDPMPEELETEFRNHVIGVQANVWTEYMPTFSQVQYMTLPRMAALAEIAWGISQEIKDYNNFVKRLEPLMTRYNTLGYSYANHVYDVQISYNVDTVNEALSVILNTLAGDIFYTLDGSEPTAKSSKYTTPVSIKEQSVLKVIGISNGKKTRVTTDTVHISKATFKPITTTTLITGGYKYNGISMLLDGRKGTTNYKTGEWLGIYGSDLDIIVDLKKTESLTSLEFNTNVVTGDWIFDASGVEVLGSLDGKVFTSIATEPAPLDKGVHYSTISKHRLNLKGASVRYLKIHIGGTKALPEWHSGFGNPGYLFIDELIIN